MTLPTKPPSWWQRPINEGDEGDDILVLNRKLGMTGKKTADAETTAAVRGVQKQARIPQTGEVDEATAQVLGESASAELAPRWFTRDLELWCEGPDVRTVRDRLGFGDADNRYDPDVEAAVRRLQGQNSVPVTGRVDGTTAYLIGDYQD